MDNHKILAIRKIEERIESISFAAVVLADLLMPGMARQADNLIHPRLFPALRKSGDSLFPEVGSNRNGEKISISDKYDAITVHDTPFSLVVIVPPLSQVSLSALETWVQTRASVTSSFTSNR